MKLSLFTLAAALSAFLALGTLAIIPLSFPGHIFQSLGPHSVTFTLARGIFFVQSSHTTTAPAIYLDQLQTSPPFFPTEVESDAPAATSPWTRTRRLSNQSLPTDTTLGFDLQCYSVTTPGRPIVIRRTRILAFPLAFPALFFSLAPALWLFRRTHPSRSGNCPTCNYDIRASPIRCPECGTRLRPPGPIRFFTAQ